MPYKAYGIGAHQQNLRARRLVCVPVRMFLLAEPGKLRFDGHIGNAVDVRRTADVPLKNTD